MDIWLWMLAVLVGYFVKGIAGIGNTLVVTAAMAWTRTNQEITPVELLLCVPTNLLLAWQNRRHINWRLTIPPLCMVLAGDVVGVLLLKSANVNAMKVVFGAVLILLGAEMLWRELRGVQEKKTHPAILITMLLREQRGVQEKKTHPAILMTLGVSAGVLCGLFGAGALLAAYFARVTRDDKVYKGSMCFIFAMENIFRVIVCSVTGLLTLETVKIAGVLALPMLVGLFAGMKLSARMNARAMRIVIIVMLMVSGLPLLLANLGGA